MNTKRKIKNLRVPVSLVATHMIFGLSLGSLVHAQSNDHARLLTSTHVSDQAILELSFEGSEFDVVRSKKASGSKTDEILLRGKYLRKNWSLFWKDRIVSVSSSGQFTLPVPVEAQLMDIQLKAVGPQGRAETQVIQLEVTRYPKSAGSEQPWEDLRQRRWMASVSSELALLSYWEGQSVRTSALALAPRVALQWRPLPLPWEARLSGSLAFLNLNRNHSTFDTELLGPSAISITPDTDLRLTLLRVDGWLGYRLPIRSSWFELKILGGGLYTSLWVTQNIYGFSGIFSAQLKPEATFRPGPRHLLVIDAKYFPVSTREKAFSFSNTEATAGAEWRFQLLHRATLHARAQASRLELTLENKKISLNDWRGSVGIDAYF